MSVLSLLRKAQRNQYRVIEDPEFWTPTFCRVFFDWCDQQAYDHPDGLLVRGELALELARKTDDPHAIAKAYGVKSSAYRMLSLYDLSKAELVTGFQRAGVCSCCLGDLYRRHGILVLHQRLFHESLELFDTAIEHCRRSNNRDGVGRVMVSRGVAFWKLGQIDEALFEERQALTLLSPLSPYIYHLGILTNIAQFLVDGSDEHFARAEEYCEAFRRYLVGLDGFSSVRVRLSWAHGLILIRLGDRKRGLQMLRNARKALMRARHDSEVLAITADISNIYCDTEKYHLITDVIGEVRSTIGDPVGTRDLLKTITQKAERGLAETRKHVEQLRGEIEVAIPSLVNAPSDAFSTP